MGRPYKGLSWKRVGRPYKGLSWKRVGRPYKGLSSVPVAVAVHAGGGLSVHCSLAVHNKR